jgi:RHS repeat-associated protein
VVTTTSGTSQTDYGFTGESYGDSTQLLYLRARYYIPADGRFQSRDTWGGDANKPMSFNKWEYGFSSPLNYSDPTGLAPTNVDCNQISPVLNKMRELCISANGDVNDSTRRYYVLTARKQFFHEIAGLSISASGALGEGYWWAGILLERFLANDSFVNVPLSSNSSFQSDRGILRATKIKLPKSSDDADEITPLLHVFLKNVKKSGVCNGTIADLSLSGSEYYMNGSARPRDIGWWGAFGHVVINATYTNSRINSTGYGYYISTNVNYTINDNYAWGHKRGTPLPLGGFKFPPVWKLDGVRKFVGSVEIPHAWEVSLVDYGWANEFDFKVTWSERLDIIVPPTFNSFSTQNIYDELE